MTVFCSLNLEQDHYQDQCFPSSNTLDPRKSNNNNQPHILYVFWIGNLKLARVFLNSKYYFIIITSSSPSPVYVKSFQVMNYLAVIHQLNGGINSRTKCGPSFNFTLISTHSLCVWRLCHCLTAVREEDQHYLHNINKTSDKIPDIPFS